MQGFTLLLLCLSLIHNIPTSTAGDTIDVAKSLTDGKTIVSAGESFAMGFFSPGSSKNRYLGIWYNNGPNMTVVWVANRNNPLNDSSGVLKLNETGILVLLNRGKKSGFKALGFRKSHCEGWQQQQLDRFSVAKL